MGDYNDIFYTKNNVKMISAMKVLRNVVDLETGIIGNVIIRSSTEDFWLKVIDATRTYRVCALGTPGIGKSTATCILVRLLLEKL